MSEKPSLEHYLALEYPYTVVPDEGSYFIKFPDLPGCMTQVEDPAEIGAMADEIRILWLETTYEDGMSIPEPSYVSGYSGKFVVRLPKSLHRDLVETAQQEGVSLNAYVSYLLAERTLAVQVKSSLERAATTQSGNSTRVTPIRSELATRG